MFKNFIIPPKFQKIKWTENTYCWKLTEKIQQLSTKNGIACTPWNSTPVNMCVNGFLAFAYAGKLTRPMAETCSRSRQGNIKVTLPQLRSQCRHETISRHMGKNTCFMQKEYRMILAQNKPRSMQRYKKTFVTTLPECKVPLRTCLLIWEHAFSKVPCTRSCNSVLQKKPWGVHRLDTFQAHALRPWGSRSWCSARP